MDDLASTQPVEYLQHLLKYLASPVDPLASLKVVRGADDSIVALRSAEGEYPVVNNVPRMLPHMGDGTTGDLALWQEHQAGMWQEHLDGDQGVFTSDDHGLAQEVGCLIQEIGCGLYLDVGCGARQRPPYMIHAGEGVEWIGIDPFFGDSNRQFPFAQALAEYLPFHPETFDGALYASTIYHVLDPLQALQRTRRVLKPEGKLFVWTMRARVDARYVVWMLRRSLGIARRYSESYQWAFTEGSMRRLLARAGFAFERAVFLCEACPDLSECDDPAEYLVMAGCA